MARSLVAFIHDCVKKTFDFVEGEELDRFVSALWHMNETLEFFCPVHFTTLEYTYSV